MGRQESEGEVPNSHDTFPSINGGVQVHQQRVRIYDLWAEKDSLVLKGE